MRVTQLGLSSNFLRNLNLVARRLELNQLRLTTGLNYQRPSDNPLAVNQILSFQSQLTVLSQLRTNVTDGLTQVDFLDARFQGALDSLREARTLAIQGGNGTLNAGDRAAIAGQLDQQLRDFALLSNTQLNGRFLFAGGRTTTQPFTSLVSASDSLLSDVRYIGNQQAIARRIGAASRFEVGFPGDEVFLEQTHALQGKALPQDRALGFSGTLLINGAAVTVNATDTLTDIVRRINLTPDAGASARIRSGALELYSDYAVKTVAVSDTSNGQLLQALGLSLRGAYTQALDAFDPFNLPLTDSTPAIFQAAGNVANLTIDGNNDKLLLHLGANANEGVSAQHIVRIPHGTYATVDDLADAIQSAIDEAFGRRKIVIEAVGSQLELRTFRTGAGIGTGDLQVGGNIAGEVDTASDSATLNLVAGPGPAPLTSATIAGTDGNDRFAIDLGALVSPNGIDLPPIEIDLDATAINSVGDLVNEINAQIRADVRLRGAVEARLSDGRIVFETTTRGSHIGTDQLALVETVPGVLSLLGGFDLRPATLTGDFAPPVPLVTTPTFREFTLTLGPTASAGGAVEGPLSFVLALGTFNTSQDIVTALNQALIQQPEAAGLIFETVDATPTSQIILRTTGEGSQYRAADLTLGGPLAASLGFATATRADGAGVAPGEGVERAPRNLFRDLIAVRDSLLGLADGDAIAKELTNADGVPLGLFDGDDIIVTFNGRRVVFEHRAGETLQSLVSELQRLLSGLAEVELGRDGRVSIRNTSGGAVTGFSITAQSPRGQARTVFNEAFGTFPTTLPAGPVLTSAVLKDPRRPERAAGIELGRLDQDMEHLLAITAVVGARSNRLRLTSVILEDAGFQITGLKTGIEAVNIAEVVTRLSSDEATLQAALQVGSRVLQPSLISYLR